MDVCVPGLCRRDPLISLNLAVFHYKLANLAVAARHLSEYERKLAALKATSSKLDVDPEVSLPIYSISI